MIYFKNVTPADKVTFEGREVKQIIPVRDRATGRVTHYNLVVAEPDAGAKVRKFRDEEIPHLIEREILRIDRGYHSLARQTDRNLYGDQPSPIVGKKRRAWAERVTFLASRMGHYHKLGMKLTVEGVWEYAGALEKEYSNFQSTVQYGTEKPNSTQSLKPLPAVTTLLEYYRDYRRNGQDHRVFMRPKRQSVEPTDQQWIDLHFILLHLYEYADAAVISKREVGEKTRQAVILENARRKTAGLPAIKVLSADRYSRMIDRYLDPFVVTAQRHGIAAARKKFGSVDKAKQALLPGDQIQCDAWQIHIVTLDTTREKWRRMTEEERRKVPRVRRWLIVVLDVATRVILGFALCRNPNQTSSLEALRMCFMDKTHIFRMCGITKSDWGHRAPIKMMVTDSGSEFGKSPFGGAQFAEAVRRLGGSYMNTAAGVPALRGPIERVLLTWELKWARRHAGWTASNPQKLNDRKPYSDASMTDDELYRQVVRFIAEYNASEHRGLGGHSPAGTWQKLIQDPFYDATLMPMPKDLREACGIYAEAAISEDGIRFKGIKYSNEFIRNQRQALGVERIDGLTGKVEIKFDPQDLGAISVVAGDDVISVKAVDPAMLGMTLVDWRNQCDRAKAEARADVESHSEAREEAHDAWVGEAKAIAKSAGVDTRGLSISELSRAALEINMGKGHHEEPFVGRDEFADPIFQGFALSGEEFGAPEPFMPDIDLGENPNHIEPDAPNALNRFRAAVKPRSPGVRSHKDGRK